MRGLYWWLSILAIAVLLAIGAQHHRYLRARRDVVADRQKLFHSPSVFHVATMLESEFFTASVGGKQLGDSQSSPTVPLLPHL